MHTWRLLNGRKQAIEESSSLVILGIARSRQAQTHRKYILRAKSLIDFQNADQAAHQQSGGYQQRRAKRDFRADENFGDSKAAAALGSAAAAGAQCVLRLQAGGAPSGNQAE